MKNQIEKVAVSSRTSEDVVAGISKLHDEVKAGLSAQENGSIQVAEALAMICDLLHNGKVPQTVKYARDEFDIGRTNAYNYLKVARAFCDRTEEGYRLKEKYEGFSYSQLLAMHDLPVADWGKITAQMSVREIARLKQKEVRKVRKDSKILASCDNWEDYTQKEKELLKNLKSFFEKHPNGKISIVAIEAPELPQREQKALSEAEEPQESENPLEAVDSQESPSEAVEPQEPPSEAEEPQESPTEIMEPQESPSEAAEPQESSSGVVEPQEAPSGAVEPQESPSEAVEPLNSSPEAVEPQENPSEAAEPQETFSEAEKQSDEEK